MNRLSTRRLIATGALVLGLGAVAVACGGDDGGSDSEREQLLALLLAAAQSPEQDPGAALVAGALQENPDLLADLTDEQVEELLALLEGGQPTDASPDTTVTGGVVAPSPDSEAPGTESTPSSSGGGAGPIPSINIPPLTIPTIDWGLLQDLLDDDDSNDAPTISIVSIPGLTLPPGGVPSIPTPSVISIPTIPSP